jgi:hypothetical protein
MLLVTVVVTCLLLLVNRVLAMSLWGVLEPANASLPRLRTVVQALFMIGMLLPEWWVIDGVTRFLSARVRARSRRGAQERA